MVIMYGIKNCDTIKKARKYLETHGIDYEFHDFRDEGINPVQLQAWLNELGWEKLINKRSTTWRNLPEETRLNMDNTLAGVVAEEQPTIIKRPVLELGDRVVSGFSEKAYDSLFKG